MSIKSSNSMSGVLSMDGVPIGTVTDVTVTTATTASSNKWWYSDGQGQGQGSYLNGDLSVGSGIQAPFTLEDITKAYQVISLGSFKAPFILPVMEEHPDEFLSDTKKEERFYRASPIPNYEIEEERE